MNIPSDIDGNICSLLIRMDMYWPRWECGGGARQAGAWEGSAGRGSGLRR
jgi:hypothetical protein